MAVLPFDLFGFLETDRACAYPSSNNYDWVRHDVFLSLLAGARGVIVQRDKKVKSPSGVQAGVYHKTGTVQFCTGPFKAITVEADCKACKWIDRYPGVVLLRLSLFTDIGIKNIPPAPFAHPHARTGCRCGAEAHLCEN